MKKWNESSKFTDLITWKFVQVNATTIMKLRYLVNKYLLLAIPISVFQWDSAFPCVVLARITSVYSRVRINVWKTNRKKISKIYKFSFEKSHNQSQKKESNKKCGKCILNRVVQVVFIEWYIEGSGISRVFRMLVSISSMQMPLHVLRNFSKTL